MNDVNLIMLSPEATILTVTNITQTSDNKYKGSCLLLGQEVDIEFNKSYTEANLVGLGEVLVKKVNSIGKPIGTVKNSLNPYVINGLEITEISIEDSDKWGKTTLSLFGSIVDIGFVIRNNEIFAKYRNKIEDPYIYEKVADFDSYDNDNKYHISKAFKELIYRLGITSDQKLKLVNAIEDCCTKIRDGEDPDDPHREISDVMFVDFANRTGVTTFNLTKNVYEGDFPHSLTFNCIIDGEEYHAEYKLNEDCTAYKVADTSEFFNCVITKYKTLNIPVDSTITRAIDRSKCYSITIENFTVYGVQIGRNVYEFDDYYEIKNGVLILESR